MAADVPENWTPSWSDAIEVWLYGEQHIRVESSPAATFPSAAYE